ncbi:MAG: hypothetical protein OEX19_04735 [Gammaproteobacteria bacterium]|nr:hypothetical protein [Gammaproteobacteria bacterium]
MFFTRMTWIVLLVLVFLFGCANHPTYYPEEADVVFFKKAGETELKLVKNGIERGYSASAAVAVTNHIFAKGRYSYSRLGNCDSCITHDRDYSEAAIGVSGLSSTVQKQEIMFGVGKGKILSLESADPLSTSSASQQAEGDYLRTYAQYNVGLIDARRFLLAATLRSSFVKNSSYELRDINSAQLLTSEGRDWSIFVEPALTMKGNMGRFSIYWQTGASVPVATDAQFNHDWIWSVLGASYRFRMF